MINIESLTFGYKSAPIFEDFSWSVQNGDAWAVLGPSGCGKSTLLALIASLVFPTSGNIRINGERLTRPRPQTGLILQDYGLLPWATVRKNIEVGLELRKFYGADGIHAPKDLSTFGSASSWLNRMGLSSLEDKYPAQLSGGQRQRTAIARTLLLNPDLLLMDEPFSSLDAPTRESLQQLTLEFKEEQVLTLILVTHSIEEAAFLGRKILLLNNPPNTKAVIFDNSMAGAKGYRESDEYQRLCKELRSLL